MACLVPPATPWTPDCAIGADVIALRLGGGTGRVCDGIAVDRRGRVSVLRHRCQRGYRRTGV